MKTMPKSWIGKPSPVSLHMRERGWLSEVSKVYVDEDKQYSVLIRNIETEWGIVQHAAIRNAPNTDIPWAEKQRIKNELFGAETVAVEVFPAMSELVDEANMYHLWVLPDGMKLPFSLMDGRYTR